MDTPNTPQNNPEDGGSEPRFAIRGQYVKDLSFENPHAPDSLLPQGKAPEIQINVDIKVTRLDPHFYESCLYVSVRASGEKSTLFLVDLVYAGVFELHNIPENRIEQLMLVDAPFILFPFARRVVADATRDGGFPPLMLEPIDFYGLFSSRGDKHGESATPRQ